MSFALLLGYLSFPAFRSSPRAFIPFADWLLAFLAAGCVAYLFIFYEALASRPGNPISADIAVAVIGVVLLLEMTRRSLGLPMVILALFFLAYSFLGPHMPAMLAHKGAGLSKAASHYWLTTEGVFGVALGVSASFIFMFVLFGALLERAGAGNYFILSAMSLLGHFRGGPAKASVVASASTGMISGSSIANVVTTGTFTIPLMKKVGYPAHKAAAVETAASVDGQIMPPVMGAAAFLMVEYVGIPYTEVLKHALLPAVISYVALFYIVHLEAVKANIHGLPPSVLYTRKQRFVRWGLTLSGIIIFSSLSYALLSGIRIMFDQMSTVVLFSLLLISYVLAVRISARQKAEPLQAEFLEKTPPVASTLKSGVYFLLPVVVLIWNLMVEHLSPGLSAFYATATLIGIVITQRPLKAFFEGKSSLHQEWRRGFQDLRDGLVMGSRNMVGIAIATAAAGVIVGTVTLTGVGLVMIELVELLSGGNLLLMLILVAIICLFLGLGLPTTANYIVVSTLMAPVVVEVGAQNGLLVPLIAVHLFVFYFGLMADVTPPVGLATYAAAGIAKTDPLKAGVTAFSYSIRTAILPFMFIFNTQLLLIGIEGYGHLTLVVVSATMASLLFAAATQGWFLCKNRWWETAALIVIAFALFRPGFFMDLYKEPFRQLPASQLFSTLESSTDKPQVRLFIEGINLEGDEVRRGLLLPLADGPTSKERLQGSGLTLLNFNNEIQITQVRFGSIADKLGFEQGFKVTGLEIPMERPAKEWIYLVALLLLAGIVASQRSRQKAK